MPKPSTFCLTGATGFIGRWLTSRIRAEGGSVVRTLSRRGGLVLDGWHAGDLLARRSLEGFIPQGATVVHLAYLSDSTREQNLLAAANLAEACLQAGAVRFIYVSTAVVTGDCPDPVVTEDSLCRPTNHYEETKLAIENLLISKMAGRCELAILRPTEVYGEGGKNLLKLAQHIRTASVLVRVLKRSLLSHRRLHLVHVDNVVEAIMHLARLESARLECRYIVSEDDVPENNYGDVSDILVGEWGLPCPLGALPNLPAALLPLLFSAGTRRGRRPNQIYDCSRLLRSGYRRPVTFQQGLRLFAVGFPGPTGAAAQ